MNKRRSILLPTSTLIQGLTAGIPLQVYVDQIMGISTDNSNPANVNIIALYGNSATNASLLVVTCPSAASAASFILQIKNYLASDGFGEPFSPMIPPASGLTFGAVFPNATTVGSPTGLHLTGTGFLLSNINQIKVDDGLGDVYAWPGVGITDDDDLYTTSPNWTAGPAGTYTVYYSTNGGGTWTTTGLTVTVT